MGVHKDKIGKSRVGVFLEGLGDVGKPLLKVAGSLTGIEALNVLSDSITTSKELSQEAKKEAVSLLTLDREDLINARESNTEIQKAQFSSWMAKNIPFCIDIFILFIWGAITIFIIAKSLNLISESIKVDLSIVLGMYSGVTALATQIVSYHRGSSAGSKMKDFIKNK